MYHPGRKREAMGDDPPFLVVGTEVSAKYKGAFCEAKVRKVVRSVKCRVTFKLGLGTAVVTDDQIKGTLRAGASVEVKHPDKKEFVEATITKIQDCSQYTVVFDDGDITTLRRTALCLKSGRHFAESETLDQLPLTHPEHFSNPVIGGRRGRRNRNAQDESSDEEEVPKKGKKKDEQEADIGKVVCVELGDKKKQKDNWFPGLVVAPTAQDAVRIRVKDDYLVRSFKDGRYYTVPKKEATEFTREIGSKVDNNTLKTAVEKALLFLDKDELPPHWDRELLFSMGGSSGSDSEAVSDIESSDDERQEEKDHFVAQLYKFMDDCGTPINKGPTIFDEDLDLYRLFKVVHKLGGYNRVTNHSQWKFVTGKLGLKSLTQTTANHVKQSYKKYLHQFEDFYRKLGCTMVNHPRGNRARHRSGRSLIRDRDRATPVNTTKISDKEKPSTSSGGPITYSAKKVELEEEKKKGPKVKEEKVKVKEEKKEVPEEVIKPRREIKPRSERLKLKEEEKKQTWRDESHSEDEGSSSGGSQPVRGGRGEPVPSPEVEVQEEEDEEEEEEEEDDDEEEEEEEQVEKPTERERRRPLERKAAAAEEEEKTLRLRSKGGRSTPERSRAQESRTPVRDVEKKLSTRAKSRDEDSPSTSNPNPPHPPPQQPKKRGRKRKDSERSRTEDVGRISSDVQVQLGDKLKVYYGQETKCTYEAKVIEIEEERDSPNVFLVHYTGWNTRYDEWIPRTRIEENLSWTPARAKRSRMQQQQQQQQQPPPQQGVIQKMGRGRPTTRTQEGGQATHTTRSTTPSSVTSSSSRTKSPAQSTVTRAQRAASRSEQVIQPPQSSIELRRRPRRTSGLGDFLNVSESESEASESETEMEPISLRRRRQDSESSVRAEAPDSRRPERAVKKRTPVRKEQQSEEEEAVDEKEGGDSDSQSTPRRRGRRPRRVTESDTTKDEPSSKSEEDLQPKGRDFDLNQIRSELKGFDKAVKSPPSDTDNDLPVSSTVKQEQQSSTSADESSGDTSSPPVKKDEKPSSSKKSEPKKDDTDDIYEFKEPEPFEFEVRGKRESSLAEERSKLSKRHVIRLFDDLPEPKSPTKKKSPAKKDVKSKPEEVSPKSEGKRRRRFPARKQQEEGDDDVDDSPTKGKESPSSSTSKTPLKSDSEETFKKLYTTTTFPETQSSASKQKSDALTASEQAFKKLYESTTFPVLETPPPARTTRSPKPLDLFADLPAEADDDEQGDDEEESRLVISETDTEPPLFSYPQRHEEMLPTPTSRSSPEPGKSCESSKSSDLISLFGFGSSSGINRPGAAAGGSPKKAGIVKLMVHKGEGEEGTPTQVERPVQIHDDVMKLLLKEDEEDEEDSINAAIQRVISQSMNDDDEMDLLPKVDTKPSPKTTPKSAGLGSPKSAALGSPKSTNLSSPKSALSTPKSAALGAVLKRSESPKAAGLKASTLGDTSSKTPALKLTAEPSPSKPIIASKLASHLLEAKTTPRLTAAEALSKTTPKSAEIASKLTPKSSLPLESKPTPKPLPALESLAKSISKPSSESPKSVAKVVQPVDVPLRTTPKPSLTADLTSKLTPKPGLGDAKPKPGQQQSLESLNKLGARSSPPAETSKVGAKAADSSGKVKTLQSPELLAKSNTKTPDIPSKISAKGSPSTPETFGRTSAKIVQDSIKSAIKNTPPLDVFGKSSPKMSPSAINVTPKTSATIAKSGTSAAKSSIETPLTKVSNKPALPSEVKAGPKPSTYSFDPPMSKTPVAKSTLSSPDAFSKTKSPPSAEAGKSKIEASSSKGSATKTNETLSKAASRSTPLLPTKESLKREAKKEPRKKALKKTVSKEFVDDTSSDSDSSEDLKLVIDKLDDESVLETSDSDTNKEKARKEFLARSTKKPEAESKSETISKSDEVEKKKRKDDFEGETSKKSKTEVKTKIVEEEDSSLNSLLCEETIPGSPPPAEAPRPVCVETPKVREIPFASMPAGGGNGASTSSAPQQPPKPFASKSGEVGEASGPRAPPAQAPNMQAAPSGSKKEDEAAPVMDNTPPTTPDSSLSTISGSPREERGGSTPPRDESGKSVRDSSEVDLDSPAEGNKDPFASEDSLLNVEVGSSCEAASTLRSKSLPKRSEPDKEPPESPSKKRRRACKKEDAPLNKRMRHSSGRSPRNIGGAGSDSDDNSENSNLVNTINLSSADHLLANRSPRPSKYNFYVELDPELDGSQRIAVLQHKLQELRKTYLNVKAELAGIDRRRKKLRRREREASKAAAAAKQEVWCA